MVRDLRRRPQFATPFLLACKTGNAKLTLPGVTCLQRLVVSQGLAAERLPEALDSLQECSKINLDNQLKILQTLPSLLQNYSSQLEGDLQARIIEICTALQQVKSLPVSSTASATLQQVVSSAFEKVEKEDDDSAVLYKLHFGGKEVNVKGAAYDAFRIFQDICLVLDGDKARFAKAAAIAPLLGLELIEASLANHNDLFETHEELAHLLCTHVIPLVTRFLTEKVSFAFAVRTTRILCIVLRELLDVVRDEVEIPLGLLNHLLESDSANGWRRALCMETFRIIYSSSNLAIELYTLFDVKEGKRNFFEENVAIMVRLASEKPALIGLGQQSSFPTGQQGAKAASQSQVMLETNAVAGLISGEIGVSEVTVPGISSQWSSLRTPCLDQLDKSEPPAIPETYIYSLVLTCLTNLSDGLARTIIPLTAIGTKARSNSKSRTNGTGTPPPEGYGPNHDKAESREILVNPLELDGHPTNKRVKIVAHMVDACWPAILATSSTFLNAALDADFYRGLIRSVQRFAQVAAILRLPTPRDAFMTTLAKSAIPAHLSRTELTTPSTPSLLSPRSASGSASDGFFGRPSMDASNSKQHARRNSVDSLGPSINQRNLMCLRALINLAIATGSVLGQSWTIIVESLQKADAILAQSGSAMSREYRSSTHGSDRQQNDQTMDQASLTSEITAVEAAVTRLISSTADYPDAAFLSVVEAFFSLTGEVSATSVTTNTTSLQIPKRSSSMQVGGVSSSLQSRAQHFALAKIGEIVRANIDRLTGDPEQCGWNYLIERLQRTSTGLTIESTTRLMAADIMGSVALGIALNTLNEEISVRYRIQLQATGCLEDEVNTLYRKLREAESIPSGVDHDIHRSAVEAVTSILDNCGDSLVSGWRPTFAILNSVFPNTTPEISALSTTHENSDYNESAQPESAPSNLVPLRIAKSAFNCVQLICSDFLGSLKRSRIVMLIDLLSQFCSQTVDINISLTTLTLFWNLSDFIQNQMKDEAQPSKSSDGAISSELQKEAEDGSLPAIWMILQQRLASNTDDARLEVRNGAVQTTFRIISSNAENYADDLWYYTIGKVVFSMLEINSQNATKMPQSSNNLNPDIIEGLVATTEAILEALATLITAHKTSIISLNRFEEIWYTLVQFYSKYLDLNIESFRTLIFRNVTQILSSITSIDEIGQKQLVLMFGLWQKYNPVVFANSVERLQDEACFVAYVHCTKLIYPLMRKQMSSTNIETIINNVSDCAEFSSLSPYSSDVDSMTALQSELLDCLKLIKADYPALPVLLIRRFATFVERPYFSRAGGRNEHHATFVAFSKRSIEMMKNLLMAYSSDQEVLATGIHAVALKSLSLAVSKRYAGFKQGREPSMWRTAATASVSVVTKLLPLDPELGLEHSVVDELLTHIVELMAGLRKTERSQLPKNDILLRDESFDLETLQGLRKSTGINVFEDDSGDKLLHNQLSGASLTSEVRLRYIKSLLESSLFHEGPITVQKPLLGNLYKTRAGRVQDPPFHPRIRMCYASLDELFALTDRNLNGNEPNQATPLARTAFPFLIFRCALPLKRYIADQPLRGMMPTPMSQRLELLHILKRMKELECDITLDTESAAICGVQERAATAPSTQGVDGKVGPHRTHLWWLVPLAIKASACAKYDNEIARAMFALLEEAVEC